MLLPLEPRDLPDHKTCEILGIVRHIFRWTLGGVRLQQREPLGRLHSFMLCVPGQLYFIPRLILQNTNGEEMQVDILAFQALPCSMRRSPGTISRM